MNTLKIGALALTLMVAGSAAAAFPGQATFKKLVDGCKVRLEAVQLKQAELGMYLHFKGWTRTATLIGYTYEYPKSTAAIATAAVIVPAVYFVYKKFVAKKAQVEETEGQETEQITIA